MSNLILLICTLFDKVGFHDALRVVCTTDDYIFFSCKRGRLVIFMHCSCRCWIEQETFVSCVSVLE